MRHLVLDVQNEAFYRHNFAIMYASYICNVIVQITYGVCGESFWDSVFVPLLISNFSNEWNAITHPKMI